MPATHRCRTSVVMGTAMCHQYLPSVYWTAHVRLTKEPSVQGMAGSHRMLYCFADSTRSLTVYRPDLFFRYICTSSFTWASSSQQTQNFQLGLYVHVVDGRATKFRWHRTSAVCGATSIRRIILRIRRCRWCPRAKCRCLSSHWILRSQALQLPKYPLHCLVSIQSEHITAAARSAHITFNIIHTHTTLVPLLMCVGCSERVEQAMCHMHDTGHDYSAHGIGCCEDGLYLAHVKGYKTLIGQRTQFVR